MFDNNTWKHAERQHAQSLSGDSTKFNRLRKSPYMILCIISLRSYQVPQCVLSMISWSDQLKILFFWQARWSWGIFLRKLEKVFKSSQALQLHKSQTHNRWCKLRLQSLSQVLGTEQRITKFTVLSLRFHIQRHELVLSLKPLMTIKNLL